MAYKVAHYAGRVPANIWPHLLCLGAVITLKVNI